MKADDPLVWGAVYVRALADHVISEDGLPALRGGQETLLALVNLGAYLRHATRDRPSVVDGAIHRLTLRTDEMLATIVSPLDDDGDRRIFERWRRANRYLAGVLEE